MKPIKLFLVVLCVTMRKLPQIGDQQKVDFLAYC
jgi:hypothetical protein